MTFAKGKTFHLVGSILCMLTLAVSFYLTAVGHRVNPYEEWIPFIIFNALLAYFFVAFFLSESCPTIRKRVYYSWILWALLHEIISFSPLTTAFILYALGVLVVGFSIYFATKASDATPKDIGSASNGL